MVITFKQTALGYRDMIIDEWIKEMNSPVSVYRSSRTPSDLLEDTNREFAETILKNIQNEDDYDSFIVLLKKRLDIGGLIAI